MFVCQSAVLFSVLWCVGTSAAPQCATPIISDFKFSISSRRNTTGHWIAQAKLEHGAGYNETDPWDVDIQHTSIKCKDDETVVIVATVTVPPKRTRKPVTSTRRPLSDYTLLAGLGYYKFHRSKATWEDARKNCEEEGAHLAVINSEAEANAVVNLWKVLFTDWAHIGNWDANKKGQFLTIFNQTLDSAGYNKWHPGEPDYPGQQNCGLLNFNSLLGNTACNMELPFICEFEE